MSRSLNSSANPRNRRRLDKLYILQFGRQMSLGRNRCNTQAQLCLETTVFSNLMSTNPFERATISNCKSMPPLKCSGPYAAELSSSSFINAPLARTF